MNLYKKAINFDLDTKQLKQYYPEPRWRKAYKDIKTYLFKNGFEHRQHSGYVSVCPLEYSDVEYVISNLIQCHQWLKHCVRQLDVTDVHDQYSLLHLLNPNESKDEPEIVQKDLKRPPIDSQIGAATKQRDEQTTDRSQPREIDLAI